jgi:hypothetical protein
MRLRTPFLFVFAAVAGLFWSLGSNVQAAVIHFVAPPLFGVFVAALWRQSSSQRQFAFLLLSLGAAELVRLIVYCARADGWRYISADSETQLVLATSFGLQFIIGVAVWGVARLFFRRHETRTA